MNRTQKKELRQRQSTRQLMEIDQLTDYSVKELRQAKGVNLSRLDVQITLQQEVLDEGWEVAAREYAVGFLRVFIDRHL